MMQVVDLSFWEVDYVRRTGYDSTSEGSRPAKGLVARLLELVLGFFGRDLIIDRGR